MIDLLTPTEEDERTKVFDIALLAARLSAATEWLLDKPSIADLPIGYFGAGTGTGAALRAAATAPRRIRAVVSRSGRPDLAGPPALSRVRAPTQLIIGALDTAEIERSRAAMKHLRCEHELVIVPNADQLFVEPGTLDSVIGHANGWFRNHLLS
ncbi:MAG: hypothetical protein V4475_02490 [Pseudomonadota bacterium]